ncbi:MAG: anti-phage dCTP deaminase [Myxococcota bacterium]
MNTDREHGSSSSPDRLIRSDELVVALVAPVGTETEKTWKAIEGTLDRYRYGTHRFKLSWFFEEDHTKKYLDFSVSGSSEFDRISTSMDAGDRLRRSTGLDEAMALVACTYIQEKRESENARSLPANDRSAPSGTSEVSETSKPLRRTAYLIHSIKRPEEAVYLRTVYGSRLILISVYTPRRLRIKNLQKRRGIEEDKAIALLMRDESGGKHGQATGKVFEMADLFVDGTNGEQAIREDLKRFFDLIFGSRLITPSKHEHAMFLAFAASLRSGDLSRQVGAVITTSDGSIVADGTNDAPCAHGGQYWPGPGDQRDIVLGDDSNERMKSLMITKVKESVARALDVAFEELEPSGDVKEREDEARKLASIKAKIGSAAESEIQPSLKNAGFLNITEYGRAVHAEMAALLSCARRGVGTAGARLYCTTFPCHNCAKHIVAAGIADVHFIEPYPKSKAEDLHGDSISMVNEEGKVKFHPFVGIGPRRYVELFTLRGPSGEQMSRKEEGAIVDWKSQDALPLLPNLLINYLDQESDACIALKEVLVPETIPGVP